MHFPELSPDRICGVDVFLEKRLTRSFVGRLERETGLYLFTYAPSYFKEENVMPLGVEFPLTVASFSSQILFSSFQDRIPDRANQAYKDYCAMAGIAPDTQDPLILLATIGKRGPSSFIFEPVYQETFTYKSCDVFRQKLDLSLQDFAHLFHISPSILQKMKSGKSSGQEVLKRLELYAKFPEVLSYEIKRNGKWIHSEKMASLEKLISRS